MSGTDYTTTPNLGLYKPIANRAIGQWGDFLNSNADTLDATMAHLSGGPFLPLTGGTVSGPLNYTATGGTTMRSAQDRSADWINVSDYGAVYDGTTGNLAAFNAARGAAVTNEIILVPGNKLFLSTPPTAGPTGSVLWQFNGTTLGTGSTPITGMGTDVVETFIGSKYFNRAHTLSPIPPVVRIDLTQDHTGGTSAQTTTALQINANSSGTSGEGLLGITSTLNCSKTAGGAQVALIGYANRMPGSANVAMFGANCYAQDQTGLPSGGTGSLVGTELAAIANDIDNGGSGALYAPDGEGIRAVLTCYAAKFNPAGADAVVGYGVSVAPHAGASFRRMFAALGPFNKAAFTTEFAIQNAGANAIWLGDNHTIALNKAGTVQVQYRTATSRWYFSVGGVDQWSVDASGNVRARGTITPSTTP